MLTSKHDLFAMAERHEPLYLMACNQKGHLTDAELEAILQIQKSRSEKCAECGRLKYKLSADCSRTDIHIVDISEKERKRITATVQCPFCDFVASELNSVQSRNTVGTHLQTHHKIMDPVQALECLKRWN